MKLWPIVNWFQKSHLILALCTYICSNEADMTLTHSPVRLTGWWLAHSTTPWSCGPQRALCCRPSPSRRLSQDSATSCPQDSCGWRLARTVHTSMSQSWEWMWVGGRGINWVVEFTVQLISKLLYVWTAIPFHKSRIFDFFFLQSEKCKPNQLVLFLSWNFSE